MHPSHQQFLLYSTLIWFFILTARNSIISLIYSPSLLHYEIYWTFQSHTLELTPKVTTCHTLPDASPYKFKPAVQFNSPNLKCILNSSTSLQLKWIQQCSLASGSSASSVHTTGIIQNQKCSLASVFPHPAFTLQFLLKVPSLVLIHLLHAIFFVIFILIFIIIASLYLLSFFKNLFISYSFSHL